MFGVNKEGTCYRFPTIDYTVLVVYGCTFVFVHARSVGVCSPCTFLHLIGNWSMLAGTPVRDPSPPQAEGPSAAASPTQMDLTASGPAVQTPPPLTDGWCSTVGTSLHINPNKGLACLRRDI